MQKVKLALHALLTNDHVRRVFHTFWVAFVAVFGAGVTGIVSALVKTHHFSDARSALIALVLSALIAGGTAVRVLIASGKA